jgi:hypothetical protein
LGHHGRRAIAVVTIFCTLKRDSIAKGAGMRKREEEEWKIDEID